MPRLKRKRRISQQVQPIPASNHGRPKRYAVLVATGIAILAIAGAVFQVLRLFRGEERELSDAPPRNPAADFELDAWASVLKDVPLAVDGPAAEFQSQMYGIVEPLVGKLPNSTRARCLLASTHRRFVRKAEAARQLQQCLALDPACAEAHYLLGLLAVGVGEYPAAEKHLRTAFDIDPRWADVPLQLANAQMSQDKLRDAVQTLETYLKLDPRDAEAWCELGQVYQKLGDCNNAKRCHLTAIDVAPEFFEAYYGAAKALRELGAAEEAQKYLDRFRQLRTSETESVRVERAKATDEDFKRRAIVDMATQAGAAYAMHGYYVEAEECWTRATTLEPTRIECQEMLCRLRPGNPERWLSLGHAYIQNGRPMEAESPFQQAIELAPQDADGYAALAQVHMLLDKDLEKAVELARTAVELEATAPNYFVLAAACERMKDWPGAKSALRHAIELDPDDPVYQEAYDKLKEDQCP